ncbi:MAG: amidohydrolase family protein [Oscillospiraceae bacterium]|nr:amidohydrolase family protein [Oscillospiraceae bacterium]
MSDFYPIIDAHCHVFPDAIAEKSKDAVSEFYDLPMYTSGKAAHLRKERDKAIFIDGTEYGITRQLICAPAVTPKQTASVNAFISQLVREDPALIGYGTLHPGNANFAEILGRFRENGLSGLKLHSDFQQFNIDEPRMFPVYEEAQRLGLPVLFHMGDRKLDYSHPRRLQAVLEHFPALTVTAAHMGGYSHWSEALDVLQPSERLYFDLSSTVQFIDGDLLKQFLDKFGEEQFFFGSDFPMWDPAEELKRLLSFGLSERTLQNILHDNFIRYIEKRS